MKLELDEFVVITVHAITCTLGFIFNAVLLYATIAHTPNKLKRYSILLMNFAVTDMLACVTSFFMMERMIPAGWGLVFDSFGPCTAFGSRVCFIAHGMVCHLWIHNMHSVLLSFCYRLYVLHKKAPSMTSIYLTLTLQYIPALAIVVVFANAYEDPKLISQLLSREFPEFDQSGHTISGITHMLRNPFAIGSILLVDGPAVPLYVAIILVRRQIIKQINSFKVEMSTRTREMHRELMKALTIQALLPIFYTLGVSCYMTGQFLHIRHAFLYDSTLLFVDMIPMLSPLVSLYFVKPYRYWLLTKIIVPAKVATTSTDHRSVSNGPIFSTTARYM